MSRVHRALLDPRDRPLANPPDRLPEELRALWFEILFACPKNYVLRRDGIAFENVVREVARYRRGEMSKTRARELGAFLGKFGVRPRDRKRVLDGTPIPVPDEATRAALLKASQESRS